MESLVIGPSIYMSTFCSTVFKVEPYPTCPFFCTYCYARAITSSAKVNIREFKKFVIRQRRKKLPVPVFRISTLVEPLQPEEKRAKNVLSVFKFCLRMGCKLILNTKSVLFSEGDWLEVLKQMAKKNHVLLQISINHPDDTIARKLEPFAPDTSDRIEAAIEASREGIPVAIRFQPIIPKFNDSLEVADELTKLAKEAGAFLIIAETVKFPSLEAMRAIFRALNREPEPSVWTLSHTGRTIVLIGSERWRILSGLREVVSAKGIEFSTCKEGFIILHAAKNCCGLHKLKEYVVRRTIFDHIKGFEDPGRKLISLDDLPREMKKRMRLHEVILDRVLSDRKLFRMLIPVTPS